MMFLELKMQEAMVCMMCLEVEMHELRSASHIQKFGC